MAGKKGGSGRPRGSLIPIGLAGHHLGVLVELWLVGYPIGRGSRFHLVQPQAPRDRVPSRIMTVLAKIAFTRAKKLNPGVKWPPMTEENIKKVIAWTERRAPDVTLRRRRRKTITPAQAQELRARARADLTDAEQRQLRDAAFGELEERSRNAWRILAPIFSTPRVAAAISRAAVVRDLCTSPPLNAKQDSPR